MDISDIDLIRTLIRTGSLSEATKHLNQSQPTLSRKLHRLEDELRTALFHRSPRGLMPTEMAKYIVAKAEPMDQQLRAIERHVELVTQLDTGTLNIGVGPIIEQLLVPGVLTEFIETTGDVQVSILTEDDVTLMAMFEASELDVIIGPFDAKEWQSRGVVTKSMISDRIVAVARKGHPIFKSDRPDIGLMRQYPLIAPKTQGTVQPSDGVPLLNPPKVSSDNYDLLRRITLRQDTICGGPEKIFSKDLKQGRLRELEIDLKMHWESFLLVREETLAAPLVGHFVRLCEEHCSEG